MCYPCTRCGRCGKYNPDSPYYVPPAGIPCLKCGGAIDPETGACRECGYVAFPPPGVSAGKARGDAGGGAKGADGGEDVDGAKGADGGEERTGCQTGSGST